MKLKTRPSCLIAFNIKKINVRAKCLFRQEITIRQIKVVFL